MKYIFYVVVLLCVKSSYAQYSFDFDSWPIQAEGNWSYSGPGGTYYGSGVYVNFGNEFSGLRKVGFNSTGDILEIPGVALPRFVKFYARLSSGSEATIAIQYHDGERWQTAAEANVRYDYYKSYRREIPYREVFTPLRLVMTSYGNSVFIDNLSVEVYTVLPVGLTEFTATPSENHRVNLTWQTHFELDNLRFDILRSTDGNTFTNIGSVAGAGSTNHPQHYKFTDPNPPAGLVYYRLHQIDYDGSGSYSNLLSVLVPERESPSLKISSTVVRDRVTVYLPYQSSSKLFVANRVGQVVLKASLPPETREWVTSVGHLPNGLYFIGEIKGESKIFKRFIIAR